MPIGSDTCERAAKVAGRAFGGNITPYGGNVAIYAMPYGCVWYSAGGSFYLNTATSGAGHASAQPVCAGTLHGCMINRGRVSVVCVCVCVCVCACVRVRACVCVCV